MEVRIVRKDAGWLRYKTPRWIIVHPESGGRVSPASFKTEKAVRRFLTEHFSEIKIVEGGE